MPTGRGKALVPNSPGVLEGAVRLGGWTRFGFAIFGAETDLRLRSGRMAHLWDGTLAAGLTSDRLSLMGAVGIRVSMALGGGAAAPLPAQKAGTTLIPDVTPVMAGTAPGASSVEVFGRAAWSCGHCRLGLEVSARVWGRHDLAAFAAKLFWERALPMPRLKKKKKAPPSVVGAGR